jgi:hypothetical protein
MTEKIKILYCPRYHEIKRVPVDYKLSETGEYCNRCNKMILKWGINSVKTTIEGVIKT